MKNTLKLTFALFASLLPLPPSASAAGSGLDLGLHPTKEESLRREGVRLLSSFTVGARLSQSSLKVANCGNNILKIKFRVLGNGIQLHTLGLAFTDGSRRDLSLNQAFPVNYESDWIDLSLLGSSGRCLKSLTVISQASGGRANAQVQVWGWMR